MQYERERLLYMCINSFENNFGVKAKWWSVCMEKPHLTLYWKEYMRMQVAHEVQRLCVESCNACQVGQLSQRQHDCLVMNENDDGKCMVYKRSNEWMLSVWFGVNSLRQWGYLNWGLREMYSNIYSNWKRSRFYVCRFIDGSTSEHWEPQTTMYTELFVSLEIRRYAGSIYFFTKLLKQNDRRATTLYGSHQLTNWCTFPSLA